MANNAGWDLTGAGINRQYNIDERITGVPNPDDGWEQGPPEGTDPS